MVTHYSTMPSADRDAFGHWLSGFTDGEGCFVLTCNEQNHIKIPLAEFRIKLRQDDRAILEEIQSFWGIGVIWDRQPRSILNANPQSEFRIWKSQHIIDIVVPHFDRYPLRAKKARDFRIWKQGVELINRVMRKPRNHAGGHRRAQWSPASRAEFYLLVAALKQQRKFETTETLPLPAKNQPDADQMLLTLG